MEQIKHEVIKLGGGRHLGVARAGAGDAEEEDGGEGEGERGGAGVAVPPVQPADGVPAAGLVPPHGDRPIAPAPAVAAASRFTTTASAWCSHHRPIAFLAAAAVAAAYTVHTRFTATKPLQIN